MKPTLNYIPEKFTWNQNDFDEMGWHDSTIYGFIIEQNHEKFTADFILDIDYIFDWVNPIPPKEYFSFWVAPCTLIFNKSFDLKINLETGLTEFELEIADLHLISKNESEGEIIYEWEIELQQGTITLKSYGFEQIVRQNPIYVEEQALTTEIRGGLCFNRKTSCL